MPAVPLIDKAALICCVEYMRNSKKASPLISNLEKHKFDARAAVGDTFPGEELWISVSSTSNVDTLSLRPCHLVGYFNNAKWILQASQFERQARQLGVPQPRVTASASAAVCGLSMAMDCPWPWTDCPWPWTVHSHGLSMAMDCPWPALIPALALPVGSLLWPALAGLAPWAASARLARP